MNSAEYVESDRCRERGGVIGMDPDAVRRLNAVTDRTGAWIVVSSSWRITRTCDQMAAVLAANGVTGRFAGCTPILSRSNFGGVLVFAPERGHEIQVWLDANPSVEAFAIVDDSSDMAHLAHRLVRTTWDRGLRDEHVERLVAMLDG